MFSLKPTPNDHSTAAAFGASCLLHGMLIAAAWMICFGGDERGNQGIELVTMIDDERGEAVIEQLETEVEVSAESTGGASPSAVAIDLTPEPLEAPNLEAPNTEPMLSQFDDWALVNFAGQVSDTDAMRLGQGVGDADGEGSGNGHFFGLEAEGQSFVFVVDSSGSMGRPYPAPARNRFNRVKLELLRTIGEMSPDQKFFIIFFNSEMLPMPANHLIPAEPAYQQQYLNWMAQVPVGGDTEPEDALLLALYLRPDVIYFLTDGAFAYRVTERVREANVRRVPIHTIGFGDNEGEEWLLKIADQSGGSYQFITQDNDAMLNASE